MPVLPFHRYIGPGNPIDSGPCVDEDDCIAKKHDIKYENARTPRDVRLADVEAITEFRANWIAGNWHSIIGDVGLSLKYAVETYTGVLYPKLAEIPPCEILTLFNDLLKLHCVHKERPFDSLRLPLCTADLSKIHIFTKPKTSDGICFIVLVAWYHLEHKTQHRKQQQHTAHSIKPVNNSKPPKIPKQPNAHLVNNYDIFHLKGWIRFSTLFRPGKTLPSDTYNDEELSDMFMLYD